MNFIKNAKDMAAYKRTSDSFVSATQDLSTISICQAPCWKDGISKKKIIQLEAISLKSKWRVL